MDRVSVLLASSHAGICQSLQQVLEHEDWIKVVGTSASKTDTLRLAQTLAPEVIILDQDLGEDSLETGRQILEMSPDAKIIVLSLYDYVGRVTVKQATHEEELTFDSVEWLSKNSSPAELIKSISAIKRQRHIH